MTERLPHPAEAPRTASRGVNVAGFLRSEIGIGEAARRILDAVERSGVPHTAFTHRGHSLSRTGYPAPRQEDSLYDTNLILVNADALPSFAEDVGPAFFTGRYSIGFWFWEVSTFAESLAPAFDFVDEVWVASDYVRASIAGATTKPVFKVPIPVREPVPMTPSRAALGLGEDFMFLFTFDAHSVFERKNPIAIVNAYTRAFDMHDGAMLVIKASNGDAAPEGMQRLRDAAAARSDVQIVDTYLPPDAHEALLTSCDCYVSLHRSEGWGLGMAEAMALGKPVIATHYSGNLEFMNEHNSFLVSYTTSVVPRGVAPYPAGAEWAEPDVADAAMAMRIVFDNQPAARDRGRRARDEVLAKLSPERVGETIAERLEAIWTAADFPVHIEDKWQGLQRRADSLERLMHQLARSPDEPLASRDGPGPTALLRRALARLLWPYLKRQREIDATIAAALRDLQFELHEVADELADRRERP